MKKQRWIMADFKTIADLGPEASRSYAKRAQELGPDIINSIRASSEISKGIEIPTLSPAFTPPEFLGEKEKNIWADLPFLSLVPSKSIFTDQILPGQDPKVLSQKLMNVEGPEAEKKILSTFFHTLKETQDNLDHINKERRRYYKG
jgi:hypothetical protein